MPEDDDGIQSQKTLYQLYLVDQATEEVLFEKRVVAWDEVDAIQKVKLATMLGNLGTDLDHVWVMTRAIGFISNRLTKAFVDKPPLAVTDLPASLHLATLKSVNPSLAKPAVVTRAFAGIDVDVPCVVTTAIRDQWIAGAISIGDIVIVAYCEERINDAIIIAKVFKSW